MSDDEWTEADDVVEEVRQIRREIWAQFDNDPQKYIAHLQELHQQLLREGWIEAPPPSPEYVERVRQALDRVRRNPHLLDFPDESGPAEDAPRTQGAGTEDPSEVTRQTAGPRQQDKSAA